MGTRDDERETLRTERVTVLMAPDELEAVRRAAEEAGRSMSSLMRYLTLRVIGAPPQGSGPRPSP